MTIEEYKEFIVKKLEKARDCEDTEQLISRSLTFLEEKHITDEVRTEYLLRLKNKLKQLSPSDFDYVHWCNIQCAILYLRKRSGKF